MTPRIEKNLQYYKFCLYGLLKNLRFFDAFLVLFLLESGLDFLLIGVLYSIREVTLAITEIPSGVIADALGRRRTLVTSFALYIFSFILFYFAGHFIWFAAAMFIFAFGDAFRTGVHKAMIFDYLKRNNREDQKVNYYGHTRSWSQAGTALSSLIAAFIVFYTGSFRLIFPATIIPYIADMFLVWSYPRYLDGKNIPFSASLIVREFKEVFIAFLSGFRKLTFIRVDQLVALYRLLPGSKRLYPAAFETICPGTARSCIPEH
ncbi:MAG: MFS transporter [Chlorobi bacterium]|nr:MFS transporter [Chlorobiota bacterium]